MLCKVKFIWAKNNKTLPEDTLGLVYLVPASSKHRRHNRKKESYLKVLSNKCCRNFLLTSIPLAHLLTWTAAPEVGDDMYICTLLWLTCQEGNCSTQPLWLLSVSSNLRKPREAKTGHSSSDSAT